MSEQGEREGSRKETHLDGALPRAAPHVRCPPRRSNLTAFSCSTWFSTPTPDARQECVWEGGVEGKGLKGRAYVPVMRGGGAAAWTSP